MSGGPLAPISGPFPLTDSGGIFSNVHVTQTDGRMYDGLGVAASLAQDEEWGMMFKVPPALPTGTAKLVMPYIAAAEVGNAKFAVWWKSVAVAESLDIADGSFFNEHSTPGTLAFTTGDTDDLKEEKTILDADTVVAGEYIVVILRFLTTSYTLAQVLTVLCPTIVWE